MAGSQAVALSELASIHARDLSTLNLSDQWVAQLASKVPGIIDLMQTTATGGHNFAATDILDEYRRDRRNPNFGNHVKLLQSTDFGSRQTYNGYPLWTTIVVLDSFSSAHDVSSWCDREFPQFSRAVLLDYCVPRQLTPPVESN